MITSFIYATLLCPNTCIQNINALDLETTIVCTRQDGIYMYRQMPIKSGYLFSLGWGGYNEGSASSIFIGTCKLYTHIKVMQSCI
jgi:hypothetical protein